MKRLLLSLLCCISLIAYSQSIERYEYWFDQDFGTRIVTNSSAEDILIEADASSLTAGVHSITFRAQDSNGSWSVPHTKCFIRTMVLPDTPVLKGYEYWLDNDFSKRTAVNSASEILALDIDASKLVPGVHSLAFRSQDSNGCWSVTHSYMFLRIAVIPETPVLTKYEYWMDNDFSKRTTVNSSSEIVALDIDATEFMPGVHTLTFRTQDSNGSWSVPHTYLFIKQANRFNGEDNKILGYKYWFNDDASNAKYVSVEPSDPLLLTDIITVSGLDIKVTPENICMVTTDEGKQKLGVKNTLKTMFKDANKLWSTVKVDTFATIIDAQNIDLTAFIVNPDASLGNKGWTVSGAMAVKTENDNPYFSLGNTSNNGWNAQMKQTVSGLPAGTYILTANGRVSENAKLLLSVNDIDADFDSLGDSWSTSALSFITDGQPFDIIIKGEAMGKNQWAYIDDLCLTMGSQSSLTVKMPEGANMSSFKNQKLVISSSQNTKTLTTTQAKEYTFRGLSSNGVYKVSLLTMYGEEIAVLDNVTIDDGDNVVTLPELKPIRNVRLKVTDADGTILTSKCNVNWQDGNGKYLANGSEIGGMVEGSKQAYTITLSDSLGIVYTEPDRTEYVVKNDANNIHVMLQCLTPIALQGTVRNSMMSMSGAQVSAVQWINGRYVKTVCTQTGSKGEFSLPVYNDSTRLTISSDGYLDKVLTFANIDSDTDLGNIILQEIVGTTLHLNMGYQKSVNEGEDADVQSWYTDMNNVEFIIHNVTADSLVTGYNVQNYSIVTYAPINVGDKLEIVVKSRNNDFADVCVNAVVSDSTVVTIPLVEKGGIAASYTSSANSECIGILYDAKGVQTARTVYTAGSLSFRQLENGDYALVSMGNSRLFGNVMNLSDLSAIGLNDGEHYIINNVSVEDGIISNVEVVEIPEIDEMLFYYTETGTSFAANKNSVTVGNYITLTTKVDFKEEYKAGVRNISLLFDLPEGCEYVDGSAIIGTTLAPCSIEDNKLTIALSDEGYTDRIRFCIVPTQSGNYLPSAFVQFSNDGEDVMQPLGNVAFTAEAMSINVPSITSKKWITASGITVPYSTVSLMDNGSLMGTTTSMADGSWMISGELLYAYNLSRHQVMAEVKTPANTTLYTESKEVEYNISHNAVKTVTMYNIAHTAASLQTYEYVTVFDFENPSTENLVYWYWPSYPDFTFLIDFANNDPEKLSGVVLYVHTSSSDVVKLYPEYDAKKDKWIATAKFNIQSLPESVSLDYNTKSFALIDSEEWTETINSCSNFKNEMEDFSNEIESLLNKLFEEYEKDEAASDYIKDLEDKIQYLLDIEFTDVTEVTTSEEKINNYLSQFKNVEDSIANLAKNLSRYDIYSMSDELKEFMNGINITDCSKVDSLSLLSEGYERVYLSNGNVIYELTTNDKRIVVDFNNNLRYEIILSEATETIARHSKKKGDDFVNNVLTFCEEFSKKLDAINDVCEHIQHAVDVFENVCGFVYGKAKDAFQSNLSIIKDLAKNRRNGNAFPAQRMVEHDLMDKCKTQGKMMATSQKGLDTMRKYDKGIKIGQRVMGYLGIINNLISLVNEVKTLADIYKSIPDPCENDQANADAIKSEVIIFGTETMAYYSLQIASCVVAINAAGTSAVALAPTAGTSAVSLIGSLALMACNIGATFIYEKNVENKIEEFNTDLSLLKCSKQGTPQSGGGGKDNSGEGGSHPYGGGGAAGVHDPSGYVYEAVSSNRIEGVTATIFQKTEEEDMYGDKHDVITKWDAEPYSQKNPVQTDANGLYAWDVPEGLWQVKFEKEGYETVTTDWLPVPPPQLDINIPMYHAVAPEVEKARGFESGVTLTFSKYMRPESFVDGAVTVTRNGMAEKGSVMMVDAEKEPTGDKVFARKVKFVPQTSFNTTDNVVVTVKKEVESYCGMPMAKDVSMVVPIEPEIRAIESDSVITVPYQGKATVTVTVVPAEAAVGKTLKAETSSPMILSLGGLTQGQPLQETIVDKDGKATFTVNGELPGAAQLIFTMVETDVVGQSRVEVIIPVTQVAAPKASIATGTEVPVGTLVSLSSDTEDAVIYYTLDGSCPCDENARQVYTEPIAINKDLEINAIAVKDGMDDSEISTFHYTVSGTVDVKDIEFDGDIRLSYEKGMVVITNAKDSRCKIYDIAGNLLQDILIKYSYQQIPVEYPNTFIVNIVTPNGKTHSLTVNSTK